MLDMNQVVEALLRFAVMMIPVAGVILLLIAAHMVGGALRIQRRSAASDRPTASPETKPRRTDRDQASEKEAA